MQVNTLIHQLYGSESSDDVLEVLDNMTEAFDAAATKLGLVNLDVRNKDYTYPKNDVFVQFDMVNQLSGHYAITITPEIRDRQLTMTVKTDYMEDGHGMDSRSWNTIQEDTIEYHADADVSLADVLASSLWMAKGQHSSLLERVGVSGELAKAVIEGEWMKKEAPAAGFKP